MRIYVASSWRNKYQQQVFAELRNSGFDVYDFWSEIDKRDKQELENLTIDQLRELGHDYAKFGFDSDFEAMKNADACVLVLPCGKSAHLEAGWMKGAGKKVVAFIPSGCRIEPELLYNLLDGVTSDLSEVISMLKAAGGRPQEARWVGIEYHYAVCSKCGGQVSTGFDTTAYAVSGWPSLYPFCPLCGAHMQSSEYDGPGADTYRGGSGKGRPYMKRCAYRGLLRYIREMEKDDGRTVTEIAIEEVPLPDGGIQLRVDCTLEAPKHKGGKSE